MRDTLQCQNVDATMMYKNSGGGKYMSRKARSEVPELPPIFGVGAELPPSLGSAGMGSEDYVEEGEGQC